MRSCSVLQSHQLHIAALFHHYCVPPDHNHSSSLEPPQPHLRPILTTWAWLCPAHRGSYASKSHVHSVPHTLSTSCPPQWIHSGAYPVEGILWWTPASTYTAVSNNGRLIINMLFKLIGNKLGTFYKMKCNVEMVKKGREQSRNEIMQVRIWVKAREYNTDHSFLDCHCTDCDSPQVTRSSAINYNFTNCLLYNPNWPNTIATYVNKLQAQWWQWLWPINCFT